MNEWSGHGEGEVLDKPLRPKGVTYIARMRGSDEGVYTSPHQIPEGDLITHWGVHCGVWLSPRPPYLMSLWTLRFHWLSLPKLLLPCHIDIHSIKNEINKQNKEMLNLEIIWHSSSPYASPTVLVYKSDKVVIDYRLLSKKTIKDKFLIPLINDLLDELYGAKHFSKLDLRSRYH